MPTDSETPARLNFFDCTPDSLRQLLGQWGWPAFRADQLLSWVYKNDVTDPDQMTNLTIADRRTLKDRLVITSAEITRRQVSADGTIKLLLTWPDSSSAESVMIPDGPRHTACLSCQVGCPVGCRFCASGLSGLSGNLSAGQIVEQLIALNQAIKPQGHRITNVVFMGMGEPMSNFAGVTRSVKILHGADSLNLGYRRLTISTVGIPARIRQLADEQLPVNLALSLHAPNEPLRRQLIPWAEHFRLDDILDSLRYYFDRTGREITFEYILLSGVNDRPQHARELARLCKGIRANVNLIGYNEVEGLPYQRPTAQAVVQFQSILRKTGVNAHVRKSRGRDIDAACGQLRRREYSENLAGLTIKGREQAPPPADGDQALG